MSREPIGTALIGFGLAGEVFHAPLIRATRGLALHAVVSSRAEPLAAVGLRRAGRVEEVLADPAIGLVVVASPNATHYELARAALAAGKHVVVDKPLALTAAEAEALIMLAEDQARVLTVFHNRRWDADFLTVKALCDAGRLGEVVLFEAVWDRHRPKVNPHWKEIAEEGGGLLNDLSPHLIDQALLLFGPPEAVTADIASQRVGSEVDDYFDLRLDYGTRRIRLAASNLVTAPRPRFQLFGTQGSYVKHGLDPQQRHLGDGLVPGTLGYGVEPERQFGIFTGTDGTAERVPSKTGCWGRFYESLADTLSEGGPPPVDPRDARTGIALIQLARRSAREGRRLAFSPAA